MSTELRVDITPADANSDFAFYEGAMGMSSSNHRLYRQFRSYNMKVKLTAPYHAGIEVYVLKDTWMVRNAIKKAAKVYHNTHVLAPGQEEKPARWHDFRMKPVLNGGNTVPRLLPIGFNLGTGISYNTTSTGQWDISDIDEQSTGTSFNMVIGAASGSQINIIQAYMDSDDTSPDEAGASDQYSQFLTSATPQSDTDDEGDLAPYNMTNLNNYLVKIDTIHSGKTTTAAFDAPLGWVFFRHNGEIRPGAGEPFFNNATGNFQVVTNAGTTACLQVIHSAGKYKGVRSEPMGKIIKINSKEYDVK